jgi:hypothetical protein
MNIKKMTELISQGNYSPANYYLGIVALLKEGSDLDFIMGHVPGSLLGEVRRLASRHGGSATEKPDLEEREIARRIVEWGQKDAEGIGSEKSRVKRVSRRK